MEIHDVAGVEVKFTFRPSAPETGRRGRPAAVATTPQPGKLPRITQMLALALHFEEMVRTGEARNYADLARLGCITRERVSQIMKLRWLAPEIQQEVLQLSRTPSGRFPICEGEMRRVADALSWREQRVRWDRLKADHGM
jgi:hypothetical protein